MITGSSRAGECKADRGLTSNDIVWLTGSGDTLWMITQMDRSLAFNMIAGSSALSEPKRENNWWSYTLGCKEGEIFDLSFGRGLAVASFDTAPNVIWTYDHSDDRVREQTFGWPDTPEDEPYLFVVNDVVTTAQDHFFACMDGGIVKWEREQNLQTVYFPGSGEGHDLSTMVYDTIPEQSDIPVLDTMRRTTGIEVVADDSLLIVTTPEKLWLFPIMSSEWDSSLSSVIDHAKFTLKSFEYVFVNRFDRSRPLYAIITVSHEDADEDSLVFCKYNRNTEKWEIMLDHSPKACTFGPKGFMYMLFDDERPGTVLRNIIRVYRDTLGDSGTVHNPRPIQSSEDILSRMTLLYDIDDPEAINDILYIPQTDSSGYLWIATSEGLFFSSNERPGSDGTDEPFVLIKRAPSVGAGLKKTYARPGILTPYVGSCKFIYNIGDSNAHVTIKIYDYNMDLVKTVIKNRLRYPGKETELGRSTVESEDSWDGTNSLGRPVAPGPYYYKITTDKGDRAFGKIVVAR
jgi:hypothetical protein